MPRLVPLKPEEVCDKLKKLWFAWPEAWSKHLHMIRWSEMVPIPKHWWKQIWVGLISQIIKEAWISRDEWIAL